MKASYQKIISEHIQFCDDYINHIMSEREIYNEGVYFAFGDIEFIKFYYEGEGLKSSGTWNIRASIIFNHQTKIFHIRKASGVLVKERVIK